MEELLDRFNCENASDLLNLMINLKNDAKQEYRCNWCFRSLFTISEQRCDIVELLDDDSPIPRDYILFNCGCGCVRKVCYRCWEKIGKKSSKCELFINRFNLQDIYYPDKTINITDYINYPYEYYTSERDMNEIYITEITNFPKEVDGTNNEEIIDDINNEEIIDETNNEEIIDETNNEEIIDDINNDSLYYTVDSP